MARTVGRRKVKPVTSDISSETWIATLHRQGRVFDIGQLTPQHRRDLDKEVKAGRATKSRELWPFVNSGGVHKTAWFTRR